MAHEGRYFDGKSGAPHDVLVEASGSHLNILALDRTEIKRWSYSEIQVLEAAAPPLPAKLTSKRSPDARLLILEESDWLDIKEHLPQTSFSLTLPTGLIHILGYALASIAIIAAACFYFPRLFESGSALIPNALEKRLGRYVIGSVSEKSVCTAKAGQQALEKIVASIHDSAGSDINYKVYVINDPEITNALSAPGGYIVLFRGALDKMDNGDEVAGVLSHEMAHLELNHPMRSLARDLGSALMLQAMFGGGGDSGRIISFLSQMSYSRADELEADDKGQEILFKAGLDPQYMTEFFEKLVAEEKKDEDTLNEYGGAFVYLSTHPLTSERIKRLQAHPDKPKNPKHALSQREWSDLKKICSKYEDFNPDK